MHRWLLTEKNKWCIKYTTIILKFVWHNINNREKTMPSCFWKQEPGGFCVSKWHKHMKILCKNAINYANKTNKVNSSRKESHDYSYQENNYTYLDSFFGAENFSGQEIVYKDEKPCWSMNYYGRVIEENFNGDFLKEALYKLMKNCLLEVLYFIKKGSIFTCCVFKEKLIFFRVLKKYIIKHIKFMKDLYKAELWNK